MTEGYPTIPPSDGLVPLNESRNAHSLRVAPTCRRKRYITLWQSITLVSSSRSVDTVSIRQTFNKHVDKPNLLQTHIGEVDTLISNKHKPSTNLQTSLLKRMHYAVYNAKVALKSFSRLSGHLHPDR